MERVQVVHSNNGLAVAVYERVLITYVRGPATLAYLAVCHREGRKLGKRFPKGIASLVLLPDGVAIPDAAVRKQAQVNTHEANEWVGAGATVVAGTGFSAAAVRSVVTAMTVFSSGPPRRVFSATEPAIAWLGRRLMIDDELLQPLVRWSEVAMGPDSATALSA